MRIWGRFKRWVLVIVSRFHTPRASVAAVYAAGIVPPPKPEPETPKLTRKARRAQNSEHRRLTRARHKFDKFVEPQGEKPVKIERRPATPRVQVELLDDDNDDYDSIYALDGERIAGVKGIHHGDDKTEVLYRAREIFGEFSFRDSILEQLDSYFVYLDRMQKHDESAWGFYKNVGAMTLPYFAIGDTWRSDELPDKKNPWEPDPSPWFLQNRPAFGCVAYGTNPLVDRRAKEKEEQCGAKRKDLWILVPRFMYYTKYNIAPPGVQHPHGGGDVYKLTIWWDRVDSRYKHGRPEEFAVVVRPDGRIEALRTLNHINVELVPRRNRRGGKRGIKRGKDVGERPIPRRYIGRDAIDQKRWCLSPSLHHWAKQHGLSASEHLAKLFCETVNRLADASLSLVKVSVEKDGRYAMFSVDIARMPYFFQDRDYQLNANRHRKRIFHMVRPHIRQDGTVVKLQFRGQREFTWAGYNVSITVPGKDHLMLDEFSVGVYDESDIPKDDDSAQIGGEEMGRRIRSMITTGNISELTKN